MLRVRATTHSEIGTLDSSLSRHHPYSHLCHRLRLQHRHRCRPLSVCRVHKVTTALQEVPYPFLVSTGASPVSPASATSLVASPVHPARSASLDQLNPQTAAPEATRPASATSSAQFAKRGAIRIQAVPPAVSHASQGICCPISATAPWPCSG